MYNYGGDVFRFRDALGCYGIVEGDVFYFFLGGGVYRFISGLAGVLSILIIFRV